MFIYCRMKLKGTLCSMTYADSDSSIFEFGIDEFKKLVERLITSDVYSILNYLLYYGYWHLI